jgi:hypothetical protein
MAAKREGEEYVLNAQQKKELDRIAPLMKQYLGLKQSELSIKKKIRELEVKSDESGKKQTIHQKSTIDALKSMDAIVTTIGRRVLQELTQDVPASKRVKEGKKEITVLDVLKKKYAWQMLYFTAMGAIFAGMVANSKLLKSFQDIIGAGLGFILDMLLVQLIPAVIWFVNLLFGIGKAISDLDPISKAVLLGLVILFAIFTGAQVIAWLANVAGGVAAIGTAGAEAAGASKLGALSAMIENLTGMKVITIMVDLMLLGASWVLLQWLAQQAITKAKAGDVGAGLGLDVANAWGGARSDWAGTAAAVQTGLPPGVPAPFKSESRPPTINVFIDGIQISQDHMRTQQLRNTVGT